MPRLSLDVVRAMPGAALVRLYGDAPEGEQPSGNEWTVRAVFGMLPGVQQQIVLRLCVAGAPGVTVALARTWVVGDGADGLFQNALGSLEGLRILELVDGDPKRLRLTAAFGANLKRALAGVSEEPWRTKPAKRDKRQPGLAQITQWMTWRWTNVLLCLIGDEQDVNAKPPDCVADYMESAGLLGPLTKAEIAERAEADPATDHSKDVGVTGLGMDYVLKERAEQVWVLVNEYLSRHVGADDRGAVVGLILTLAFATPGGSYSRQELSEPQVAALDVLFALGLVYMREGSSRFYPTPMGVAVAFGAEAAGAEDASVQIIVQTNFQVVAYTDAAQSSARLALVTLGLFCELAVRLPNMLTGTITRDAVKRCVAKGIRVPQMVNFLEAHAHPRCRGRALPDNVRDQMVLWSGEDQRVAFSPGCLIACRTPAAFDRAVEMAREMNRPPRWRHRASLRLFVDAEVEAAVRKGEIPRIKFRVGGAEGGAAAALAG